MDVLHVVGARPNFPKLAPVYAALANRDVSQYVVHTGQHFDPLLSEVLFKQLGLPKEDENLGVGSGSHAQQTALVMQKLEDVVLREKPSLVVVYGDVNSTVAATLVATKLGVPVAHVEAGLRSGDRSMPEELNRLVTDAICDIALTTSEDASDNLLREGRDATTIHFAGNPMIDSLRAVERTLTTSPFASRFAGDGYGVVTMHRPGNVDDSNERERVVNVLTECAEQIPLVFPVHPRRRQEFEQSKLGTNPRVLLTGPLPYVEFLSAVREAGVVITDSGGVQEETTIFGIPCLTLRPNTERPVTIWQGTNRLVTVESLPAELRLALAKDPNSEPLVPPLWDGRAGERIADVLLDRLQAARRA